tara:strand:+ start:858 stop:1220 length:363 start_codon:yes stop_codon:yes gene_type:complete
MDHDNHTAERSSSIDTRMLMRRIEKERDAGNSIEALLTNVSPDVLALLPIEARTPDAVPGSMYDAIADGATTARFARNLMDQRLVIHSDYARRWLEHAECEQSGMSRNSIAMAEVMDLIA